MATSLSRLLEPYGDPEQVIDLRTESPEGLPYIDLLRGDRRVLPDGVLEVRKEPLAYLVDLVNRDAGFDLPRLRKTVTLRGDAPYLIIIEPGKLVVHDTSLPRPRDTWPRPLEEVLSGDERARMIFQRLSTAPSHEARGRFLHDLLYDLLNVAIQGLEPAVGRENALSLAGRALFMRFLIDREIVTEKDRAKVCPDAADLSQLFTGPMRTLATCRWMNHTFNGDFLPLSFLDSLSEIRSVPSDAFGPLEDVMRYARGGQLFLDWSSIDFSHVPVGLLSQVYERQAETWDPVGKRREGVYFTPRRIAELMVREVFASIDERGPVPSHQVRVLDPAVGGGVFLVSAFQELVRSWWRHHGQAPDTGEIRSILYDQLTGFDISEPALQLTALSLYLKAIEMDREPHPPAKLRFKALRGRVLHSMRSQEEEESEVVLGSLGPSANGNHRHRYDIVIGNPPWTPLPKKSRSVHERMVEAIRPVAQERLGASREKFQIPDLVPDLPFVWRAMEWAKPSGWIAFALHGRLLFKRSDAGRAAREDLFRSLEITGVLNGADLRKTEVWPGVDAPFCLLFALNRLPPPEHAFYFVSPYLEEPLNQQGRLRIDSKAAHPVEVRALERADILKTLFRGTALDAALLNKLRSTQWPTLLQYFCKGSLKSGQGYQVGTKEREVPNELLGLPELTSSWNGPRRIDPQLLPRFRKNRLQWPRRPEIFRGPLTLVRKSLPSSREKARALCCFSDLVYSESFFGYSTFGHSDAEALARYLCLLIHSELFSWHTLMTSGEFGVERDSIHKDDIDTFPIRPIEDLSGTLRAEIVSLSEALFGNNEGLWPELDAWVSQVYGLNRWDQEILRDTLAVALPFSSSQKNAQRPPEQSEITSFAERLERELRPFVRTAGQTLQVLRLGRARMGAPWEVIILGTDREPNGIQSDEAEALLKQADQLGASQILWTQPEKKRLLLGILLEYRYWTQSRARLCALEILKDHLGALLSTK